MRPSRSLAHVAAPTTAVAVVVAAGRDGEQEENAGGCGGTGPCTVPIIGPRAAASQVTVPFEPPHGEVAPDGRQVERRQAVEQHGGERRLLGHAGLDEPEGQAALGHADAARYGDQARQEPDADVDEQQLPEPDGIAEPREGAEGEGERISVRGCHRTAGRPGARRGCG